MTKNEQYSDCAQLFKTLASPIRLQLINFISFAPRTVESCAIQFNQSSQNISLHLLAMAKVGILKVSRFKNYRIYSLAKVEVLQLISQELKLSQRYLAEKELFFRGNPSEAMELINQRNTTLIDLRRVEERDYIPLKYAVPFEDKSTALKKFVKDLPNMKLVLFVCRGQLCERLSESVKIVSKLNLKTVGLPFNALELRELAFAMDS
ncbi:MAG: hypothetical protein KC478_12315 [Bacteriovoracaceae bacterium]|nr:hypothetical protein [Bacteriovoracaceae bacterium]